MYKGCKYGTILLWLYFPLQVTGAPWKKVQLRMVSTSMKDCVNIMHPCIPRTTWPWLYSPGVRIIHSLTLFLSDQLSYDQSLFSFHSLQIHWMNCNPLFLTSSQRSSTSETLLLLSLCTYLCQQWHSKQDCCLAPFLCLSFWIRLADILIKFCVLPPDSAFFFLSVSKLPKPTFLNLQVLFHAHVSWNSHGFPIARGRWLWLIIPLLFIIAETIWISCLHQTVQRFVPVLWLVSWVKHIKKPLSFSLYLILSLSLFLSLILSAPSLYIIHPSLLPVIPMKKMHKVQITWSLPSLLQHYRSVPSHGVHFFKCGVTNECIAHPAGQSHSIT